ncbi:hypothetical protein PHLGIDRAFT_115926 [Phlebiopsis gigantea 11061_1 CR5-6]|uniref:Uncharacterized protein n=1 Tax=Phlebiopsis gigantea (strain 11061_1 CR5-6) TaxID=745531 RepID=A0A0C3PRP5_PHLG1|nr:hypothetical protein PHLGIDRAFT_115926 [Phlebiopsis gigantea 11061_1 CR5-6]
MSTDVAHVTAAFNSLSILAVVFSSLSALFGAYVILFIMSIWATYRYTSIAQRRLRQVSIALFTMLTIHYIARAVHFAQSRSITEVSTARTIPVIFVIEFSSTVAGTLSDGLLAWRFYVLHDRARWALYVPTVAIFLNTMLGFSGDFQILAFYRDATAFSDHIEDIACQINAAWGWCMLGINTFLSGAMTAKILISRTARSNKAQGSSPYPYGVVLEAIAESALITWIGLLLYGITSLAPHGRITTHMDVGYVMGCVLPMCFGISQCLITTRLGFSVEGPLLGASSASWLGVRYSGCNCQDAFAYANEKGISVTVHRETITDNLDSVDSSIAEGGPQDCMDGDIVEVSRCATPRFKFQLPALTQQSSFKLESRDNNS